MQQVLAYKFGNSGFSQKLKKEIIVMGLSMYDACVFGMLPEMFEDIRVIHFESYLL